MRQEFFLEPMAVICFFLREGRSSNISDQPDQIKCKVQNNYGKCHPPPCLAIYLLLNQHETNLSSSWTTSSVKAVLPLKMTSFHCSHLAHMNAKSLPFSDSLLETPAWSDPWKAASEEVSTQGIFCMAQITLEN